MHPSIMDVTEAFDHMPPCMCASSRSFESTASNASLREDSEADALTRLVLIPASFDRFDRGIFVENQIRAAWTGTDT